MRTFTRKLPIDIQDTMPFSSLGLPIYITRGLAAHDYETPYPIQEAAIPAILDRKDVLGIAQTGSGKTASYVLPILCNLMGKTEAENRHVNVLVLVPTRELAGQVADVFRSFSTNLPESVRTVSVFGGVSINPQMKSLRGVNILVATPGRLIELIEHNAVHLDSIQTLVLDEADKMLNLGFKAEMDHIIGLLPKKRQNLLFSATLSDDVTNIHQLLLNDPVVIKIEGEKKNIELINEVGYHVSESNKGPLLRYLIKTQGLTQVLVFTSSVFQADKVVDKLKGNGINARAIHSKKSQGSRREALIGFKQGQVNVLVATDLLARGIDIEYLPCVINYELPRSPKDYIHRIGRTGRAESPGDAYSFISEEEKHHFRVIQKKMGRWVTMVDTATIDLINF
jgi:ATP-dependent RNA helicase RhlE